MTEQLALHHRDAPTPVRARPLERAPIGPPKLRDYQTHALDALTTVVRAGCDAPLVVAPTGSGKTTVGGEASRRHLALGGRVLWLAHRQELIEQAAERLESFGLVVGVICGSSSRPRRPHARVQVATPQTLRARSAFGVLPPASMVVFDEAHHYVSADWNLLAGSYGSSLRLGLTATPERSDGIGLGHLFSQIIEVASIRELTEQGYLVPLRTIAPSAALKPGTLSQRPVDAYLEHAARRHAVVFAPNVRAARVFADEFLEIGIPAVVVHHGLPPDARARALAAHDDGAVLVNVNVLTEGWDSPQTSCAILARRLGSVSMLIQIAGRVLRPFEGKADALLIDLPGVSHIHGLADEDRAYSLEGEGIRRAIDMGPERFCRVCGAPVEAEIRTCADCGHERPEPEVPTIVRSPLVRFEVIRRDPPEKRAERLARWLGAAAAAGHRPGAALHKYRAVYGDWPTFDIKRLARTVRT